LAFVNLNHNSLTLYSKAYCAFETPKNAHRFYI